MHDKSVAAPGLSTYSYLCLSVLKVTCPTILVGTLGKCDSIGEHTGKQITLSCGTLYSCS